MHLFGTISDGGVVLAPFSDDFVICKVQGSGTLDLGDREVANATIDKNSTLTVLPFQHILECSEFIYGNRHGCQNIWRCIGLDNPWRCSKLLRNYKVYWWWDCKHSHRPGSIYELTCDIKGFSSGATVDLEGPRSRSIVSRLALQRARPAHQRSRTS